MRASTLLLRRRSARGLGGRCIVPGSACSVPSAIAGTMSVPRSMASTCITTSGSGTAPPLIPQTRKGTSTVRAEEAEDLGFVNLEVELGDAQVGAVELRQSVGAEDGRPRTLPGVR